MLLIGLEDHLFGLLRLQAADGWVEDFLLEPRVKLQLLLDLAQELPGLGRIVAFLDLLEQRLDFAMLLRQ